MTGAGDSGRQAGGSSAHIQRGDPQPPALSPPLGPAGSHLPLEDHAPADPAEPVPEQELSEVEAELWPEDFIDDRQYATAENLVQRQQDHHFLQVLAAAGFVGTMWDYFANELAAYGTSVLMSWMRTGKIARLCADKGRPIRALPTDWQAEDRSALATLTVAKAINVFRDRVLRQDAWDPTRGATIKTFFMGLVIQQFPNHYNSWCDERMRSLARPGREALEDAPELAAIQADRPDSDPARTAISRVHLIQVLRDMPEDLRVACLLILEGHSIKDAAGAIGKTGDALSEQLRRYRNGRGGRMR
jgi:hypothetical protein